MAPLRVGLACYALSRRQRRPLRALISGTFAPGAALSTCSNEIRPGYACCKRSVPSVWTSHPWEGEVPHGQGGVTS